jgi:putative flippase GtrA
VIRQLARFGVVGIANTLISLAVYAVLLRLATPHLLAAGLAFAAGAVNGYVLNRRWTFGAVVSGRARTAYVVVQLGGLLALTTLVRLLADDAAIGRVDAYLAAVPPVTLATFALNRVWTFSQRAHSRFTGRGVTVVPWTRN